MLVKVFVVGSHTTAVSPWLLSPQVKTLPSGSNSPCIATMGQFIRLPHWPVGSELAEDVAAVTAFDALLTSETVRVWIVVVGLP